MSRRCSAPARAEGNIRPGESIIGFDLTLTRAVSISGTCEGVPEGLEVAVLASAGGEADAMERRFDAGAGPAFVAELVARLGEVCERLNRCGRSAYSEQG